MQGFIEKDFYHFQFSELPPEDSVLPFIILAIISACILVMVVTIIYVKWWDIKRRPYIKAFDNRADPGEWIHGYYRKSKIRLFRILNPKFEISRNGFRVLLILTDVIRANDYHSIVAIQLTEQL